MDMQAAPPTYAEMDTGRPPSGNPPMLGQQVPGFSGGLPAQGGLSVLSNPMAQELQSQGRGQDSMLVHMTPNEVNSLQGLAMAHGGSLTINPNTGLPEAGFLGKLLPTIIGFGLNFVPGVGPLLAAGLTAAGSTAATGSLKKGLMAGLQAYGGASLAGAVAPTATGTIAKTATAAIPAGGANIATPAISPVAGAAGYTPTITATGLGAAPSFGPTALTTSMLPSSTAGLTSLAVPADIANAATTAAGKTGLAGVMQRFGQAATQGLPAGTPGFISKAAPMLAGSGLLSGVSGALSSSGGVSTPTGQVDNSYQGPYYAEKRTASFAPTNEELLSSTKERRYFNVDMPEIRNVQGQLVQPGSSTAPGTMILQPVLNPKAKKGQNMYDFRYVPFMGPQGTGYAKGGEVPMDDGAFVLDARTVSEVGNGSSNAGKEVLRRIGGMAIEGPGDGVSDSVPARIGRDQPARVARDEVVIPAEAVRRIGKGNAQRGADKLYALMDKAHKARKNAKRGQDTKLRRGLAL